MKSMLIRWEVIICLSEHWLIWKWIWFFGFCVMIVFIHIFFNRMYRLKWRRKVNFWQEKLFLLLLMLGLRESDRIRIFFLHFRLSHQLTLLCLLPFAHYRSFVEIWNIAWISLSFYGSNKCRYGSWILFVLRATVFITLTYSNCL